MQMSAINTVYTLAVDKHIISLLTVKAVKWFLYTKNSLKILIL